MIVHTLLHDVVSNINVVRRHNTFTLCLASFPGPAQLSIASSTEKQERVFVRTRGEPGNEATLCLPCSPGSKVILIRLQGSFAPLRQTGYISFSGFCWESSHLMSIWQFGIAGDDGLYLSTSSRLIYSNV